jgi:hypothetical protein
VVSHGSSVWVGNATQSKYYFHAGTAIGRISVASSEKISNLHAENCDVVSFGGLNNYEDDNGPNGKKYVDHKYYYAGGIIGTLEHPSNKINIENYTSNNVNVYARGQAGGIAGTFSGGTNGYGHYTNKGDGRVNRCTGVIMKNCHSVGEIATSGGQAGGLVAGFGISNETRIFDQNGFISDKNAEDLIEFGVYIKECSHKGDITAGGELTRCGADDFNEGTQIAGLIAAFGGQGDTPVTFNDCYSKGKISGSPLGEKAGFLCGFGTDGGLPINLRGCISESYLIGSRTSGMIVGFSVNSLSSVTIEDCCVKSDIRAQNSICGGLIYGYEMRLIRPLIIKNCSVQGNNSGYVWRINRRIW